MPASLQEQASVPLPAKPQVLAHAPEELVSTRLARIGEGVGRVVYASQHWVVKRERSPSAIIALILIWKVLRRVAHVLPERLRERLLGRPSRMIRLARVMVQPFVSAVPRSIWLMTHAGEVWRVHRTRGRRGERLARAHLAGTGLIAERIAFPPTRVRVGGWPGWLVVEEASERVEDTLHQRIMGLANLGRWDRVEQWLDRFLECRQAGWQRGVFSADAHLKNFGVIEDRVVLLDTGGLTKSWNEIHRRLTQEEQSAAAPHVRLGLERALAGRPDVAERFNERWTELVSQGGVLHHWPER